MREKLQPTARVSPGAALVQPKRKSKWMKMMNQWQIQVMVIPGIVLLLIFAYLPMWGLLTAFQDYRIGSGFLDSKWVGFKHFHMFFSSGDFASVMKNTLSISLLKLLFGFPAPLILALMLNEVRHKVFKTTIQTFTYLPHFISWIIVSGMVISLLSVDNGSVNMLMEKIHLIDEPVNWLSTPKYFWSILITTGIWKDVGFSSVLYLAAIAGVDPSLYEAASIDGASRFKQIFLVTIPCIAPVIIILLILAVGNILNAGFEEILVLTKNGQNAALRPVSDVIDTYSYRMGIVNSRYSYAAAVGLFKSVLSVVMLVTANFIARKLGRSSLW